MPYPHDPAGMSATMPMGQTQHPIILIGGTSHTGKSTLGQRVAIRLGTDCISTDQLGRHPGRPWPRVAEHVAEHYLRLSSTAVYAFLLAHHENLWPQVLNKVQRTGASGDGPPLVIEGSALRPEFIGRLDAPQNTAYALRAAWIVGEDEELRRRIRQASGFDQQVDPARQMISAFIERSLTDNARIRESAQRLGFPTIDCSDPAALDQFVERCVNSSG